MLLSEFYDQNKDILLDPLKPEELLTECMPGTVFFLVSVSGSKKPMAERPVLHAKYAMPVNVSDHGKMIEFLCLTTGGYAKVESVYPDDLKGPDGRKILYRVRPMPAGDYRIGKPWSEWASAQPPVV